MTREDVLSGVRECLARVRDGLDPSTIKESDRVIEDLGVDSLDLLDLIFQLERRFSIRISPRSIERAAQERLGGTPLEIDGVYTPEALAELRIAMPEIPADELREGIEVGELPRLFRVGTFVNLVLRVQEDAAKEMISEGKAG
jgi:acyl carrier protein